MSQNTKVKDPEKTLNRFIERHNLDLTEQQHDELLHMVQSLLSNRDKVISKLKSQLRKFEKLDNFAPSKALHSQIVAGLRCTIIDHGPITRKHIESAAKRIKAQLLA